MGISINLYRVSKAENINELKDLKTELFEAAPKKIDLYKMTEDLAIIFLNQIDPFTDTTTIPYKMLFGNAVTVTGHPEIGGFIPSSQILTITNWIKEHQIDTPNGFAKMYADLSAAVKAELDDIGSPDHEELYDYVRPMTSFYLSALEEGNAVIICGE